MLDFSILVLGELTLYGIQDCSIIANGKYCASFCPTCACGSTHTVLMGSGLMGSPLCCIIQEALAVFLETTMNTLLVTYFFIGFDVYAKREFSKSYFSGFEHGHRGFGIPYACKSPIA